jgi:hypothetical protein
MRSQSIRSNKSRDSWNQRSVTEPGTVLSCAVGCGGISCGHPWGVALALIFYFVVRGGLFSSSASGNDISPFGVAAISGMVGDVRQTGYR